MWPGHASPTGEKERDEMERGTEIDRAMAAYKALCVERGWVFDCPSAEKVGNTIHLSNVNGPLATYEAQSGGRVRRVSPK
jgi:hypothetical protein